MSVSVDPRLAARRYQVHENWARRRLRWLVGLTVAVLLFGAGYALLQSPWLAVRNVTVSGVANTDITDVLSAHDVVPGTPTVGVRPGALISALESDPWILRADVGVAWPGSVEVVILERRPAAWVDVGGAWALVATDGVVLTIGNPPAGAAVMRSAVEVGLRPGDAITDPEIAGAVAFLGALPVELALDATARATPTGIEAEIEGHRVLLGNTRDVDQKVATLVAILATDIPADSVINVISPSRPGVTLPTVRSSDGSTGSVPPEDAGPGPAADGVGDGATGDDTGQDGQGAGDDIEALPVVPDSQP